MKKWVSLFLAVAMLFALSLPVFAAKSEAQEAAQTLYDFFRLDVPEKQQALQ